MNKPVFYILLGLWLCCGFHLTGQENLVPNGSFEEYSECPQGNELNNGQFERAVGWWSPNLGTPDYFHRCNNSIGGVVGVPNNFWGHQEPYHGNGYVGLLAIEVSASGTHIANEYIRTELIQPLKPFTQYKLNFHVNLANFSTVGHAKLGVLFTEFDDFLNSQLSIEELPQLVNIGSPIIDTANWTRLEFIYTASGCEQYLTIGYFSSEMENDTIQIAPAPFGYVAYYYVDSITLVELEGGSSYVCAKNIAEFPNVMTPNGDGYNDYVNISTQTLYIESVEIINRWGGIVAILNENNTIWDGGDSPDGVYFYRLKYKNSNIIKTGFIHLIR